jgi:inner membrane transporter RhtA
VQASVDGGGAPFTARVPAWSLAVASMFIVQFGSAVSVRLFPIVGTGGTSWLRLTFGAVAFVAVARPRLRGLTWRELRWPVLLGVDTGLMTLAFLAAIDRIPLGTAVAIEFLGPLTVAVVRSRDRRALVWPLLALVGVVVLTEPWTGTIDPVGVVYAVAAGTGWGIYILLTQHVGDRFAGIDGLSISIPVAAVVAAFVGVPQAWGHLTPTVLLTALVAALLMPVIPFTLELLALRRLTAAAFGTLMALEPGFGTLIGALVLAQVPTPLQALGVAFVVAAGIGAERIGHRDEPAAFEPPGG